MRLSMILAAALALGVSACGVQAGAGKVDKAEVEKIIAEWVKKNPEAIVASVNGEEPEEKKAYEEAQKKAALALWNDTLKPQLSQAITDPMLGPANAPITIVEYTDYNCPFCRAAHEWVMKQVNDPRRDVRVIFKEMPIPSLRGHETSPQAAHAALAADKQGKYLEMHAGLMKLGNVQANDETAEALARKIGLNFKKWQADTKSAEVQALMDRTQQEAKAGMINGTPTFFINSGEALRGYSDSALDMMLSDARAKVASGK